MNRFAKITPLDFETSQRLLMGFVDNLNNPDYHQRTQAISAVAQVGMDAIPTLLDALGASQRTPNAYAIAKALILITNTHGANVTLSYYLDVLALKISPSHDNNITRFYMLMVVSLFVKHRIKTNEPALVDKAIAIVSPFLDHPNASIQEAAVLALSNMSPYATVSPAPVLFKLLQDVWQSPKTSLLNNLITCLTSMHYMPALPFLEKLASAVTLPIGLQFAAQLAIEELYNPSQQKR